MADRLRAALEMAERERQMAIDMRDTVWRVYRNLMHSYRYSLKQRDEARQLARQYYQLWHTAESELLKRVNGEQK